jgi:hypothetical protein
MDTIVNAQPPRRTVILLGLPACHLAYLWEQALGRNTRPSLIVEELLDAAKQRDPRAVEEVDIG